MRDPETFDAAHAPALDRYLARFEAALGTLPATDRADILLETRSHVVERTYRAPDRTIDEVLAELGPPEEYAGQFLPEPSPTVASAPRDVPREAPPDTPPDTLHALARLATGRLTTLPLLAVVLVGYSFAIFCALFAIVKVTDPSATGIDYLRAGREFHARFVMSDPAFHPHHDPLGWWLVPVLVVIIVATHLLMRALLRRVLRRRSMSLAAVVVALLLPMARGAAQATTGQVEGIVTTAADATPVAFALVRLLPAATSDDTTRRQAVASAQGRYRIAGVPAGEYRVQLLRIGYQPFVSAPLHVRAGETLRHDVRATTQPVQLAVVRVRAGATCLTADRFAEEPRLATLWTEVRKGLELRRAFERQYRFRRHGRQDIRVRRVVGTKTEVRLDSTVSEPDSVDARDARRAAHNRERGYAEGGLLTLPYEKELLTEAFMRDHCIDVTVAEEAGLLGLRFRPVHRRKEGADVRGTIWVEGDSYHVRRIDFEYIRGSDAFAWGHLDYADVPVGESAFRLPTGGGVRLDPGLAGLLVLARDATATLRFTYRDFELVTGRE